jgi:diaminohydroxyphosphoribosylaminopyrimidine deaminase/5-amino-6-(5-phosphoribosylamino)uracil reductase
VEAIIQARVKRAFIGMQDPNPLVNGKGIERLREAGVSIKTGILEEACREVNEIFIKYITTKRPFVILKAAASLDGRIAAVGGQAKWITNEQSRQYVHRLRNQVDAVLVGIGTVAKDDPVLTARLPNRRGRDPMRIIVDSTLKISAQAKVFNPLSQAATIVATTPKASPRKIRELEKKGGRVVVIPSPAKVNLQLLMKALGKEEITSVLIEGGERINTSALEEGIVDKVVFFFAPYILGGTKAPMIVGGKGVATVADGLRLERIKIRRFGDDVMVEGYLCRRHPMPARWPCPVS